MAEPTRRFFNPSEDVKEILRRRAERRISTYVNSAIECFDKPPLTILAPRSDDEAGDQIRSFIEETKSDIIIMGLTLINHAKHAERLLAEKLRQGISIVIVSLPYQISSGSILYSSIENKLENRAIMEHIINQNSQAKDAFFRLKYFSEREGVPATVSIYDYDEVPMCGLMIRDHLLKNSKMRMYIYSRLRVHRVHPVIDIDPSTPDGSMAYNIYHDYYSLIRARSKETERSPNVLNVESDIYS